MKNDLKQYSTGEQEGQLLPDIPRWIFLMGTLVLTIFPLIANNSD